VALNAWLKQVVINHCLQFLRKQHVGFSSLDDVLQETIPDERADNALADMNAKQILQWIHELPTGYRTVFNLFVFEEMSHKEIASQLGISENTSKSQLHKARLLLQQKINQSQKIA
jgi:RNA polymerase sigma-70 factor (ECF subfamily)